MGGVSNEASRGSVGCERGETKAWPLNDAGVGLQIQAATFTSTRARACVRACEWFLSPYCCGLRR